MPRTIKAGAVQMNAEPAPTSQRLERAETLVSQAAEAGADLVVLPELFNTGYAFRMDNYRLAETVYDQTVPWMKNTAARYNVHLAGTLMLRDIDEVYNSALLIAPDGRTWRYDKTYPWAWERAYFREGSSITIADTDLGQIGMMICWDYAHADLWQRYSGKVDAMLIMASPPHVNEMTLKLPDGGTVNLQDGKTLYSGDDQPFGADLDEHIKWMRVPALLTTGAGHMSTTVPRATTSLGLSMVRYPHLWKHLGHARDTRVEADFFRQTKIINVDGTVSARVEAEGDGFTVADMTIADTQPHPNAPQPRLPYTRLSYFFSDVALPAITINNYRRGYRRQYGTYMAPRDHRTKVWRRVVVAAFLIGYMMNNRPVQVEVVREQDEEDDT